MSLTAPLDPLGRADMRRPASVFGTARIADNRPVDIFVDDISSSGCHIRISVTLQLGQVIGIGIAGLGRCQATVVRHTANGFGCVFHARVHPATLHAIGQANQVVRFLAQAPLGKPEGGVEAAWLERWRGPLFLLAVALPWLAIGFAAW